MHICRYQPQYQQQIIDLILHIQNDEAKIALPLEEQPDLLDIPRCYEQGGVRPHYEGRAALPLRVPGPGLLAVSA